jgi:uncharacterized radical SAM superfamily Fe-S cluster-containing enzyme
MDKVYSHTLALCPECKSKIIARIIEKNKKIYMEKFCTKHGLSEALICSDVKWYRESQNYIKPGKMPLKHHVREYKGCPDSCGLCPEHQQHTCLPVIEITDSCNLNCPVCLKKFKNHFSLSLTEFENIIDTLSASEGKLNLINLSGGEPTLHPDFEQLIVLAIEKGVAQISVSTNGIDLLNNPELRYLFKQYGVIVALQFDGFLAGTYLALRGTDLSSQKVELIRILEDERIKYSLVSTIVNGINDSEITNITDFFFNSDALSLMFQPVTFTGNSVNFDVEDNRITIPDVIKKINQSEYIKSEDFNPIPCSHFACFAVSYYLKLEDGNFLSLKDFLGREKYLDLIANRALPGLDEGGYSLLKDRIYELWSAADTGSSNEIIISRIQKILRDMNPEKLSTRQALLLGMESLKAIFIHHFMDIHNFDFGRLIKCCNPYPQSDGRLIPMCAQNIFYQ